MSKAPVPTYSTGSFNYLRRAAKEQINGHHYEPEAAAVKLDIAIAGAGIGGLGVAIALRRDGHIVTVYETAPVLGEIGAGIQVPSNSSRILHGWGLKDALEKTSEKPKSIIWRRWQDGKVIANTRLNPEFEEAFGSAYYITHRGSLHSALHSKAIELGVVIHLDCRIVEYDQDGPTFVLANGKVVSADLVIAADGLHSLARTSLQGSADKGLQSSGYAAYRAKISVDDIKANETTAGIMDTRSLNLWAGDSSHVMAYSILGDKFFNLVFTYPENTNLGTSKEASPLETIQAGFASWDQVLATIIGMVQGATKWPIQNIVVPQNWASASKKIVLLGDAAHAMVPFMALGAAMAIEDAATLAACLQRVTSKKELGHAIDVFQKIRIPRVNQIHEASTLHDFTMHLPDGSAQRARDAAMEKEVAGKHFVDSPNQWSDPTMQSWIYTYDPIEHVRQVWTPFC